jgi:hypothetical protein
MIKIHQYRSFFIPVVILVLSVLTIVTLQKPLLNQEKKLSPEDFKQEDILRQSQLSFWKKFPSLGFNNLIADGLFLNFVQYYGDGKARDITGYDLLSKYYELIVKNDPYFLKAYFVLDPATSLFAGRPDLSVEYLKYGLKYITPDQPLAYQLWLFKATNELLFLGKTEDARKSFEMAAQWAKKENSENSLVFSQIFSETANFLEKNADSKKARASAWLMILGNAREDKVRQIALKNLQELGAKITINGSQVSVSIPDD